MIGRQRLHVEDVKGRPGDRARPQGLDEGAFIMIGPREVFTSQDVVFMSASSAAPIRPRVRRLRIKWTVTTSAWRKSSSFVTKVAPAASAIAGVSFGSRR